VRWQYDPVHSVWKHNLSVPNDSALVSIAVTPTTATIALGRSQQYQAVGTYSDGSTQNVTALVGWSSTTTTVATVDGAGQASGVGQGATTLTANFESIAVTVSLTVGPQSTQIFSSLSMISRGLILILQPSCTRTARSLPLMAQA
jgi:hypothetical protein